MEEDIPLKGRKCYFNQMYAIMHIHVANNWKSFEKTIYGKEQGILLSIIW